MTNTEKEAVRIAISLFRACAASKTPLGLAVLVNVEDALTKDDISFGPLADGLLGEQGNDGGIIINDKLVSDPAMVSVGLVHEAYHRFAHRMERLGRVSEQEHVHQENLRLSFGGASGARRHCAGSESAVCHP